MKITFFIPFVFLMVVFSCKHTEKESYKRPYIIFIIGDDVGWNDPGCYGSSGIKTPNPDKLASEGLRFDNAFLTGLEKIYN